MEKRKSARDFCFYFSDAYLELNLRGLLTDQQLERITNLLDMMETLPPELFKERLERIFPEEDVEDTKRLED